jgi:F-type H+-transporting ATPase subunit epsilon
MSLKVKILTVDGPFWEASAEEVILPSTTGQLGVLTGHIHLLTGLDTGVMRAKIDKKWVPIVLLNGGFAEIVKDVVKITTYIAIEGSVRFV